MEPNTNVSSFRTAIPLSSQIVLSSFKHGLFSGQWWKHVSYIRWEGVFRCIPIYGMSFACQSQVLPTYDSLDDPSVKIMSSIFALSLNVVTTFYITVGFFGYVSFTESIAGNVLVNFPSNLVTEMIRVGFMMSVAVGFPMMILPCRQALNTLLFEQQQKDGTFTAGGYMPPLRFKVLTLVVVFGTMLCGILIPNVETILGLTGATMGSLICLICPALIYKKIHNKGLNSQFILGVGLVILVISTYATLTVTEEPTKIKSELQEREDLKEEMVELEQIHSEISDKKPAMEQPGDDRDKPKLPPKKPEEEQIKGPIEVPQKKDTKKQEEVQLDRPDQGDIAVPVGEAHRHEPPVPRDEVAVDENKDQEEREEKKESVVDIDSTEKKDKQQIKLENELEMKDQAEVNKRINEPLPQNPPKEVDDPNKQQLENPPTPRLKEQPQFKDLEGIRKIVDVPVEIKKNTEIAEKRDNNFANPAKAIENPPIKDEKNEQEPHEEPKAGDNQAEAGKAELLDHAFLLQVIKEQQVQQKRLLDQQEKLLEVIKEQHMEIHQQKEDEDQQDKLEGNIADKNKEELKAEARVAQKPLEGENAEEVKAEVDKSAVEEPVVVMDKEQNPDVNEEVKGNVPDVKMNDNKINVEEVKMAVSAAKQPQYTKKQSVQENFVHQQSVDRYASDNHKQQEKAVAANIDNVLPNVGHIILQETAIHKAPVAVPGLQEKVGKVALQTEPKQKPFKMAGAGEKLLSAVQEEKILVQKGKQIQEVKADKLILDHKPVPDHGLHENKEEADAPVLGLNQANDIKVESKKEHIEKPNDGAALEHDEGKQNRDLKAQNDMDLRRKKRDVSKVEQENDGAQIISFHPVPNLKVNDLRGALEARLNQMVDGGLQVVQSRQIKQLLNEQKKR
ncbi:putative sodium-coupled neutral amino acid transporter 10 [Xenopus laevis]|uniref:Sodium-coupled neutral amino acid transporter 10 n=1 Tax=Xenopus laevis TaxID=8355 RepID=A0A8J1LSF1_XENLA|nr:putative sodium-coupled neutral amino acid transporter 10 [Xenopus laevis]